MTPEEKRQIIGRHAFIIVGLMFMPMIVMIVMDSLVPGEPTAARVALFSCLAMTPLYIGALLSLSNSLEKHVK